MTASPLWPLQQAIYACLAAAPAVTGLLAQGAESVFDHAPERASFPYVVIDEASFAPAATQAASVAEVRTAVRCHSRAEGLKEAKAILNAVIAAITEETLAVPGWHTVLCRLEDASAGNAGDGATRTASASFRLFLDPVA